MTAAASALVPAARRRPIAVVAVFVIEAVVAWVLASPWAEVVARVMGAHPDGDRALWLQPGLPTILDLQRRVGAALAGLAASTFVGLAAWSVFGVFVLGALLAALAEPELSLPRAIGRGAEVFWRLVGLAAVATIVAVLVLVLVGLVPARLVSGGLEAASARTAAFASLVPIAVALVALAFLRSSVDLARARIVRHDEGVVSAIASTLRDRREIASLVARSAPRWLASIGLLGLGAAVAASVSSLLAVFVAHQSIALVRVGLRASVLARALRLVGPRGSEAS